MSVACTAVLEVSEDSVLFLSGLLQAERVRRGTREGRRVLGTGKQAVLELRWFLDDTRMSALARDNGIALSTAYDYRDEGISVLAARRPSLHGALLAAGELTVDQQACNAIHGALRCLGDIVAATLVLLHHENRRTT